MSLKSTWAQSIRIMEFRQLQQLIFHVVSSNGVFVEENHCMVRQIINPVRTRSRVDALEVVHKTRHYFNWVRNQLIVASQYSCQFSDRLNERTKLGEITAS